MDAAAAARRGLIEIAARLGAIRFALLGAGGAFETTARHVMAALVALHEAANWTPDELETIARLQMERVFPGREPPVGAADLNSPARGADCPPPCRSAPSART